MFEDFGTVLAHFRLIVMVSKTAHISIRYKERDGLHGWFCHARELLRLKGFVLQDEGN